MILVGPAPEEPPRVPVDAGDVHKALKAGLAAGHLLIGLVRERLEGGVDKILKLLLVSQEPGPIIVEGEIPQKPAGFFAEALKHMCTVFHRVCVVYHTFAVFASMRACGAGTLPETNDLKLPRRIW